MPYILCVEGPNSGEEWFIGSRSVVIGRSREAEATIYDSKASREHARIFLKGASHYLEDLGSKNGTYVESEKVAKPVELKNEAFIQVGQSLFLFTTTSLRERVERQRYSIGNEVLGTSEGAKMAISGAMHEVVNEVVSKKHIHIRHSKKMKPGSLGWMLQGIVEAVDTKEEDEKGKGKPKK